MQDFVLGRLAILGIILLPAPRRHVTLQLSLLPATSGHATLQLSLLPAPRRHAMKTGFSTSGKAGVSTICSAIRRQTLLSGMCSSTTSGMSATCFTAGCWILSRNTNSGASTPSGRASKPSTDSTTDEATASATVVALHFAIRGGRTSPTPRLTPAHAADSAPCDHAVVPLRSFRIGPHLGQTAHQERPVQRR